MADETGKRLTITEFIRRLYRKNPNISYVDAAVEWERLGSKKILRSGTFYVLKAACKENSVEVAGPTSVSNDTGSDLTDQQAEVMLDQLVQAYRPKDTRTVDALLTARRLVSRRLLSGASNTGVEVTTRK